MSTRIPDPGRESGVFAALDRHPAAAVDLTDSAARAQRDALADRVDVIDRVGVLRMLPDDMHANADMVAGFYETTREVIRQTVLRNKNEFDADGYTVLTRAEVSDRLSLTPDELGMPPTAPSMSLFPRRAILRIGMLLRDSAVARQVRDYLLNAERSSPFRVPQTFAEALRLAADEHEARELAEAKVAELEPKAEFYDDLMDADGTYSFLAVSKMIGWGRNVMMRELRRAGILQGNNLPYQRYEHHFKITPQTYKNRKTGETVPTATTSVYPSGIDFLRKKLAGALELAEVDA